MLISPPKIHPFFPTPQELAATKIQSRFRGNQARSSCCWAPCVLDVFRLALAAYPDIPCMVYGMYFMDLYDPIYRLIFWLIFMATVNDGKCI